MLTLFGFSLTAAAGYWNESQRKTLEGKLTCLACDLKGLAGVNAQCETFGHRHSLRLDNGEYVYFLENDHSENLIKGGGRHDAQVKVTGIYNKKSHTIDIESYEIDGLTTAWCDGHKQMDMCGCEKAKELNDKTADVQNAGK
jgi:hypothetical protein